MDIIYNPVFLTHDTGKHPENKIRIECLGELPVTELDMSESDAALIHSQKYIETVRQNSANRIPLDPDTILSEHTIDAALYAVAATVRASESDGFAVVRPPGHHAYPDHGSGFCIFNSMAIAARKLELSNKRVLIFDFDGHLGDGTESIFYESNRVMYCSIHQFPAFPQRGSVDEIGANNGIGYTVNVTLPAKSGDDIYRDALNRLLPIMKQFSPDVVGVSAGFDGHHSDPLLDLNLSVNTYYEIGSLLRENFPHMFATLEGGYNTDFLPKCFYNFLSGVNGNKKQFEETRTESTILTLEEYELSADTLMRNLRPHWKI